MQHQHEIKYELFPTVAGLAPDEKELLDQAAIAMEGAYAPYSRFRVGCALQIEGEANILGNNQENPAFPSSLCAERTALYYAGSQGKSEKLRKIAIRARSELKLIDKPVTPCGACRQVMLEYERLAGRPLVVLMQGEKGEVLRIEGVATALLPLSFDIDF